MGLPQLPPLPALLVSLPGWQQRRRLLGAWALAAGLLLLRPHWPLRLLPGWVVGGVLLWAVLELLCWAWWPRRWR
jgi:hypothetical protein